MKGKSSLLALIFFCLYLVSYVNCDSLTDVISSKIDDAFIKVCYGELGCFDTGPPFFDPLNRSISLPPVDPSEADTKFKLFTPGRKDKAYELKPNEDSLRESGFDEHLPLKILIFGYNSELTGNDNFSIMKDTLLDRGQYNVIIVDWSKSNHGFYPQAVANARLVGAQVSQLVKFLQDSRNFSTSRVHIIGHSLGAQVAGYVGKRVKNIKRITGLDPAGPLFTGTASVVHLEAKDADFVDVIHTNMGKNTLEGFGTTDIVGDIDFYPNGGSQQPACHPGPGTLTKRTKENLAVEICDHFISVKYFIASIKDCKFIGTECQSYEDYEKGVCESNQKAIMGYDSTEIPGVDQGSRFYLDTSSEYPYCSSQQGSKLARIVSRILALKHKLHHNDSN